MSDQGVSKNPGARSVSSIARRTEIDDRNIAPGRAADFAEGYRASDFASDSSVRYPPPLREHS